MKFLHFNIQLRSGDQVQVNLDKQANVRLLDDNNFRRYKSGGKHNYYGGLATQTPYTLAAPHTGNWHLVVDLGDYGGRVNASVNII